MALSNVLGKYGWRVGDCQFMIDGKSPWPTSRKGHKGTTEDLGQVMTREPWNQMMCWNWSSGCVMISHHFHVTTLTMTSWIKSWKSSHRNRRICSWSTRRIIGYRMSDICVCFRGLHCDFGFSRTVCDSFRSTLSDAGHLASRRCQVWRCFRIYDDFCWYV